VRLRHRAARPGRAADPRQRPDVPGAAHLLRWAQLRRTRDRDGQRPDARAAVLLHQARRRAGGARGRHAVPARFAVAPPRDGAGGRHRLGRRGDQRGRRAEACLGLLRRARHDAARLAERGQEDRPPVGHGQGLRPLRTHGRAGAGQGRRSLARQDRAEGQRRSAADLGPVEADLERAGGDLQLVASGAARPWRPHHDRHARGRGGGEAGRPAGGHRGGRGRGALPDRL
ncbi:MAG: Fumarylacetoacetate hydrolase family protein, partial [uncultured Acetobacteraceae bacterium]